jgi:hypothetical protein
VAFVCCLVAGTLLIVRVGFDIDDPLGTALGLYFIGKAFFVGPMLYLTAARTSD